MSVIYDDVVPLWSLESGLDDFTAMDKISIVVTGDEGEYPEIADLDQVTSAYCFRDWDQRYSELPSFRCSQELFCQFLTTLINLRDLHCARLDINLLPQEMPSLVKLDCSGNDILQSIPRGMTKLKELNIRLTNVREIPGDLESLERISCDSTLIEDLTPLPSTLKTLYCSHNDIEVIPDHLTSLMFLDVSDTDVRSLPQLSSYQFIDCSDTEISFLPYGMVNLVRLCCKNTNLCYLPPDMHSLRDLISDFDERLLPPREELARQSTLDHNACAANYKVLSATNCLLPRHQMR